MPDFEKFLKGISKGVKNFYAPIKDANKRRAQEGKPKSIKSNVKGDLDVTYDKDGYAKNPHPLQTDAQGKMQMKPDYFTENSTILDEHVVDSKDPKTSKYNELRNSMPKPPNPPATKYKKAEPKPSHPINKKMENFVNKKRKSKPKGMSDLEWMENKN